MVLGPLQVVVQRNQVSDPVEAIISFVAYSSTGLNIKQAQSESG